MEWWLPSLGTVAAGDISAVAAGHSSPLGGTRSGQCTPMICEPAGCSLEGSDLSPGSDPSLTLLLHSQEGTVPGWGHGPCARASAPGEERVPWVSRLVGDARGRSWQPGLPGLPERW